MDIRLYKFFLRSKWLLLVFSIISLIFLFLVLLGKIEPTSVDFDSSTEIFVYVLGIAFFCISSSFVLHSLQKGMYDQNISLHQSIGGYVPSDELNELIKKHYFHRGGTISPKMMNFSIDMKVTEKLLDVLDTSSFETITAQKKIICQVQYKGECYTATSASKEMALCIAFLKTCGVNVDG